MELHDTFNQRRVIPVEGIINKIVERFKRDAEEFLRGSRKDIAAAEEFFLPRLSQMCTELLAGLYEEADAALAADREGRKRAGLVVERRGDGRQVLTRLGEVRFRRTYYQRRDRTYCYPIDEQAGIAEYERVSGGVSLELVETAREVSYGKSSKLVTGGAVSRQTVMHKVRQSRAKEEVVERRKVPVLHVDADEDHVKRYGGGSTTAPLIVVYEGIEMQGKRGVCINPFRISEYGKSADELWETALTEMERRYDLDGTKIYLHGDGASWIKTGLNWLPNSVLVLDRYHVNKALAASVSGIERKYGCQYEYLLREALRGGEKERFLFVRNTLLNRWPEREKSIREGTDYLFTHFDAIHIWHVDAEARNGGATEPHVSTVLSARLSSRPMAWSEKTLKKMLPILAAKDCELEPRQQEGTADEAPLDSLKTVRPKKPKNSLGLPDPDLTVTLPGTSGKVTPLFNALRPFIYSWPFSPTTT